MTIESGILSKIHVSITLNKFFNLSKVNKNLEIRVLNELRQPWGPFTGKYFDKWTLSEKHKIPVENCCLLGYKFYMTVTCNETTT